MPVAQRPALAEECEAQLAVQDAADWERYALAQRVLERALQDLGPERARQVTEAPGAQRRVLGAWSLLHFCIVCSNCNFVLHYVRVL